MSSKDSRSLASLSKVVRASRAESRSSNSLASSMPEVRFWNSSSNFRKGSSLSLWSLVSARTSRACSWLFQKSGLAALASSSSIFWVRSGMSKIPPEIRQATLERAGVDRQEVSDVFVFHKEARGKGEWHGGQWICRLHYSWGRWVIGDFLVIPSRSVIVLE